MKLFNGGPIIVGLAIFLAMVCAPFLYNLTVGGDSQRPELELPDKQVHPNCVAPLDEMRSAHMDLLNAWRDSVVRDGERMYKAPDGTEYEMSLSQTCLDCHSNKENFCDRCHDYMGVHPYCWDCHNVPGGE